ncbi:hypothetical protein UM396_17055 [Geobacillus subterraneus]|uniref:hypothetical protein n=1 Tax=Geobacillus subterraneus TaxID=129338 RepID=UPI002AC8CFF9|nr:hypothetical protein [Geobacillus subterraneus]WPZ18235.1 hypothetical protein UM396_17055 [Geobacillus subterraneus]
MEEGLKKGREEGREEERKKMIRHMAAKGMTAKDIAGLTGLAEEESSQVGEIVWGGALFIRKFSKRKGELVTVRSERLSLFYFYTIENNRKVNGIRA